MKKSLYIFLFLIYLIFCTNVTICAEESQNDLYWFMDHIASYDAYTKLEDSVIGSDIVVAVIDTGVDINHPFLKDNLWTNASESNGEEGVDDDGNGYIDDIYGYDFFNNSGNPMDDSTSNIEGHGTHVAGTILRTAGVTESSNPFRVKVMCLKVGDAYGNFNFSQVSDAIKYAVKNGARVINMSFGSTRNSETLSETIEWAKDFAILVAAAGNTVSGGLPTTESDYTNAKDFYPAGYSSVIGVMAHNSDNLLASFSNWDYNPYTRIDYEISAPGVDIYSSTLNERYKNMSGTSMASSIVSGCAALLCRKFMDEKGNITCSMCSLAGHLMRTGNDTSKLTDIYGQSHIFHRLNLLSLLKNPLRPEIRVQDIKIVDEKVTFSLCNWQSDAKNIQVTLRMDAFGKNNAVESSYSISSISGLETVKGKDISFSQLNVPVSGTAIDAFISVSYENGADKSDDTIYQDTFPFSIKTGENIEAETVVIPLTGLTPPSSLLFMQTETNKEISVSLVPANATNAGVLYWESSEPDIVSVSAHGTSGVLYAKKVGAASITVSSPTGIQTKCDVIVKSIPPTNTVVPSATPAATPSLTQTLDQSVALKATETSTPSLEKPIITSCKVSKYSGKKKYKVQLKWKRNRKASGYQVYRRTKKGKYSRIKWIKSNKVIKYVDKRVKWKKNYYYKVKAIGNASIKNSKDSRERKVYIVVK